MDIKSAERLVGTKVSFPEGDNPDATGIITDVWEQPSIDLKEKKGIGGPMLLSDDEIPDKGNYPKSKTSPKILFRIQFDGYVYIMESGYFVPKE